MGSGFVLALAYLGFVSLGLPDALFGVAWPFMRTSFGVPQSAFGTALIGIAMGFFVSSTLAGRLLHQWGVGPLLAASTGVVALALLGYASAPGWILLLACTPVLGLGSGAIDAGLNAFAASRFSPRQMNWLHASYGLGTAIGPLVMTAVLAGQLSWRWGYVAVAAIMLVLALLFVATRSAWQADATMSQPHQSLISMRAALRFPSVWRQVLTFFVYTGAEITAGQWCFALLSEGRGFSSGAAGLWTSVYWGSLFAGRVLLGFIANRLGAERLVWLGMSGGVLGAALFATAPTDIASFGLVLLGISLAPIYPMKMLQTPARFGPDLSFHAVGFQVSAAMLGGVVLPAMGGLLADEFGLEATAWLTLAATVLLVALQLVPAGRTRS
jgi:fucose permease